MSFQPVVPLGGFAGWSVLQRTMDRQREVFDASPQRQRLTDYFTEKIGAVTTPEQLVNDRRLLTVALGAFGLDADIDAKAFIAKVLEGGTSDPRALANRLADKRYSAMAEAFGWGEGTLPATGRTGFARQIVDAYLERQFEIGVGESDNDLRLALALQRDLAEIAGKERLDDDAKWFSIMGQPPLRRVFEVALGLPPAFGAIDVDQQLGEFRERAQRQLGISAVADFAEPEKMEELTRRFILRAQMDNGPSMYTRGAAALALLGGGVAGGGGPGSGGGPLGGLF